jgi:hypothetical protein
MSTLSIAAVAMLAVITGASSVRQDARTHPAEGARPAVTAEPEQPPLFPSTPSPYDGVFGEKLRHAQRLLRERVQEVAPAPQQRTVCGMTVIQADPTIDPKMVLRAPENGPDHKIIRIEPPACHEQAPRPH